MERLRGEPVRGGPRQVRQGFQRHTSGLPTVEDTQEHRRVLLHVEDDGQVRPAEEGEGGRRRVQAEAGLHSQLQQAESSRHQQ